jgi:hypothetical protein
MNLTTQRQGNTLGGKLVADSPGVGHRPGQPVQLGDHQRVTRSDRSESLIEAGPPAVGAGQAMIEVDPFRGNGPASGALGRLPGL